MSLLLLFLPRGGISVVEIQQSGIPITIGDVYELSFKIRTNLAQNVEVIMENHTELSLSLDQTFVLDANVWTKKTFQFTATATDEQSILKIIPQIANQSLYLDKFRLINLSVERKQYRLMRIQGNLVPGSFLQTLTLREKTTAETA